MKLWILRPVENATWLDSYDTSQGFVVCAETEQQARELATATGGYEIREEPDAWLNPKKATCEELRPSPPARIVMQDFLPG